MLQTYPYIPIIYTYQQGVDMKKLNTLFTEDTAEVINKISDCKMNSKSEVARAAMTIGLSMLSAASLSMTDKEFYHYINDCQDIDQNLDPKPLEK